MWRDSGGHFPSGRTTHKGTTGQARACRGGVGLPLLKPLADNVDKWAVWVLSWVLLLVVIVLRRYATATPQKGPQRAAVAVAAISFVIWVYVMKGDFGFYELGLKLIGGVKAPAPEKLELAKQFLSSLALVVWTLLVPVFYKGEAT